jgi:hypothetical protein
VCEGSNGVEWELAENRKFSASFGMPVKLRSGSHRFVMFYALKITDLPAQSVTQCECLLSDV